MSLNVTAPPPSKVRPARTHPEGMEEETGVEQEISAPSSKPQIVQIDEKKSASFAAVEACDGDGNVDCAGSLKAAEEYEMDFTICHDFSIEFVQSILQRVELKVKEAIELPLEYYLQWLDSDCDTDWLA